MDYDYYFAGVLHPWGGLFSLFLPESVPRILGQRLEADVAGWWRV